MIPSLPYHLSPLSPRLKLTGYHIGRSFYICPRPLGPSGEKEKNSEWRCGTFIWSSDWNSSSA
jgi:AP endonuclease 2